MELDESNNSDQLALLNEREARLQEMECQIEEMVQVALEVDEENASLKAQT